MPTLDRLTEADLRILLPGKSASFAYGHVNRVLNPERIGRILSAQVQDSSLFEVEVWEEAERLVAYCTCGDESKPYCRHAAALLLKWVQTQNIFTVSAPNTAEDASPIPVVLAQPPPTHRPKASPFWVADPFPERQQARRKQLASSLENLKIDEMRGLAAKHGWPLKGNRKADLAVQLVERLVDPKLVREAVAGLDEEHRRVLTALVLAGTVEGNMPAQEVDRVARALGKLKTHKQVTTYTRHLVEAGLAVPGTIRSSYSAGSDYVPISIAQHLPPLLAGIVPTTPDLPATGPARGMRLADPTALVRAANQVALLLEQRSPPVRTPMPRPRLGKFYPQLRHWDYNPNELAQAQQEGKIRRFSELLLSVPPPAPVLPDDVQESLVPLAGSEGRLDFIVHLLLAAGIFQPGSPLTAWPEMKARFLQQSETEQLAALVRSYLPMGQWNEVWEVLRSNRSLQLHRNWRYDHMKPEDLASDLASFRVMVLRTLSWLPDGQWVMLADFFRLMQPLWPRIDHLMWQSYYYTSANIRYGAWFLTRHGKMLEPGNQGDWDVGQGAFIRQVIAGPLHWLGLADLYLEGESLVAFRLHGLADLYWDRVAAPAVPAPAPRPTRTAAPAEALGVDGEAIHVDPTAISAQLHSLLDRMARLETATANRFTYRLDSAAVHQSFESGLMLSDLLDGWARLSPHPMPDSIRQPLENWWASYGRVRIYQELTVIEFDDDYALAEMKAVTALTEHLVAEVSPRLVIITREGVNTLAAELEKAGYSPRVTERV